MTIQQLIALLDRHGYLSDTAIDRFDVKRAAGEIIGADIMFTDGTVAYLTATD